MKHSASVSLREYEKLTVNLPGRSRTALEKIDRFVSVSRPDSKGKFDVTASHWVGSVILPDGYVSVAPKVGGVNALRMMLEGEGELPESWKECLARIDSNDLWDVLALALGREMALIRAAGYQGAYVEEEDNRQAVRGKILPMEDLRFNFPVRRGVYSRDAVWSFDIELNRALHWAASALLNLARFDAVQSLRAEASLLSGIKEIPPQPDWLPEPGDRYRRAIFLAQLVRKAWAPQTSLFGYMAHNAIVNMYQVFESFTRARISRFAGKYGLMVLEKGSYRRLFSKHVQVEPDLVFTNASGRILAIGDVKYKWQWKFDNADVFQMHAYLDAFPEASTAYVFYPDDVFLSGDAMHERLPRGKSIVPVPLNPKRMFDNEVWENVCRVIAKTAT